MSSLIFVYCTSSIRAIFIIEVLHTTTVYFIHHYQQIGTNVIGDSDYVKIQFSKIYNELGRN